MWVCPEPMLWPIYDENGRGKHIDEWLFGMWHMCKHTMLLRHITTKCGKHTPFIPPVSKTMPLSMLLFHLSRLVLGPMLWSELQVV